MDLSVMNNISYGLYILSVNCYKRDNACIINSVMQVTSNPNQIVISLNKNDFTAEMLEYTDDVTISILSEKASFDLFKRFGFQSGKDVEKFDGFDNVLRCDNKCLAVTLGCNAYIEAHITNKLDMGTHILYVASVANLVKLNNDNSATYAYYHSSIKPQPEKKEVNKTIYRCEICGYEYVGDTLPDDFICPTCKHPASDFKKIEND